MAEQNQPLIAAKTESIDEDGDYTDFDHTAYKSISTKGELIISEVFHQIEDETRNSTRRLSLLQRVHNVKGGFAEYTGFSKKQKTIYSCFAIFFAYFLAGSLAFSYFFENWSILDSMYFTVVTFTTCGFGDLTPEGDAEMIFAIFFLLIGIVVLATVAFGILFENLFDAYDNVIEKARENSRTDFVAKFGPTSSSEERIEQSLCKYICRELVSVLPLVAILFLGAFTIGWVEGWSAVKSIYFLTVTSTSVGYGDVTPESQEMRAFCIFFIPFAIGVTAEILSRITGVYVSFVAERTENEFMSNRLTEDDIDMMDIDDDGVVNDIEFMRFMLVTMGKVSGEDWDKLQALFKRLDASNDGSLSIEDLKIMANQK